MPELSLYVRIKNGFLRVNLLSPPEHRFWKSVDMRGPIHPVYGRCWVWTASKSHNGYGQIVTHGKSNRAHRYSYEVHVGDTGGLDVLHRCDNPACVRPDHLFLGTAADNQKDKTEKGRQAKGEQNGFAVLTEADVMEIRRRYSLRSGKYHDPVNGQGALAKEFNVTQANISEIVRRKTWKHM